MGKQIIDNPAKALPSREQVYTAAAVKKPAALLGRTL